MGLRRIGRRIGRSFRRVSRSFRRITKFGSKLLGVVTKPLSAVMKPFQSIVGSILGKLPFGQFLAPFASAFLGNPLALLNPAVLGPMGGVLQGASSLGQLNQVAQAVAPMAAFASPDGRMNLLQMTAQRHAQLLAPRLF